MKHIFILYVLYLIWLLDMLDKALDRIYVLKRRNWAARAAREMGVE